MQFAFSLRNASHVCLFAPPLQFSCFCDRSLGPGLQPTDQVFKHVGKIAKSDC